MCNVPIFHTPLVTWLTLPQPGPTKPRAEDGGNEMVTREYIFHILGLFYDDS